jgi:hypothetical protein
LAGRRTRSMRAATLSTPSNTPPAMINRRVRELRSSHLFLATWTGSLVLTPAARMCDVERPSTARARAAACECVADRRKRRAHGASDPIPARGRTARDSVVARRITHAASSAARSLHVRPVDVAHRSSCHRPESSPYRMLSGENISRLSGFRCVLGTHLRSAHADTNRS